MDICMSWRCNHICYNIDKNYVWSVHVWKIRCTRLRLHDYVQGQGQDRKPRPIPPWNGAPRCRYGGRRIISKPTLKGKFLPETSLHPGEQLYFLDASGVPEQGLFLRNATSDEVNSLWSGLRVHSQQSQGTRERRSGSGGICSTLYKMVRRKKCIPFQYIRWPLTSIHDRMLCTFAAFPKALMWQNFSIWGGMPSSYLRVQTRKRTRNRGECMNEHEHFL